MIVIGIKTTTTKKSWASNGENAVSKRNGQRPQARCHRPKVRPVSFDGSGPRLG